MRAWPCCGTAYQLPFDRLLKAEGLSQKDVRFTNPTGPPPRPPSSTRTSTPPSAAPTVLLKLAGSADIPVSTKGRGDLYAIHSTVIATEDFAGRHPEALTRIVKVLQQAHAAASGAIPRETLFQRFHDISGLPVQLFSSEFEGTDIKARYSPLLDAGYIAHFGDVIEGAKAAGIVRQGFDPAGWADPRFLDEALRTLKLQGFWSATSAASAHAAGK